MADKLATAFTPVSNPADVTLMMLADPTTGERQRITIVDFFARTAPVAFGDAVEVEGTLLAKGVFTAQTNISVTNATAPTLSTVSASFTNRYVPTSPEMSIVEMEFQARQNNDAATRGLGKFVWAMEKTYTSTAGTNDGVFSIFVQEARVNIERFKIESNGLTTLTGQLVMPFIEDPLIRSDLSTGRMRVAGGNAAATANGAYSVWHGSDHGNAGDVNHFAGNNGGGHLFYTVGATKRYEITDIGKHIFNGTVSSGYLTTISNGDVGSVVQWISQSTNNGGVMLRLDSGLGTNRVNIRADGNVLNVTGTYGVISDVKLKENITAAKSQWDDIKAVQLKNYVLKGDKDNKVMLGVVAQELEAAGMGGLVMETADVKTVKGLDGMEDTEVETGEFTKSVKSSILYLKAVGALQEAMIRIEALENR